MPSLAPLAAGATAVILCFAYAVEFAGLDTVNGQFICCGSVHLGTLHNVFFIVIRFIFHGVSLLYFERERPGGRAPRFYQLVIFVIFIKGGFFVLCKNTVNSCRGTLASLIGL